MLCSVSASTPASTASTHTSLHSPESCFLSPALHTRVGFRLGYTPMRVRDGCMHPSSLTWLEKDIDLGVWPSRGCHRGFLSCFLVDCGTYLGVPVATIRDRNNSRKDLLELVVSDNCSALWERDNCRCVELSLFMSWLTRRWRGWD